MPFKFLSECMQKMEAKETNIVLCEMRAMRWMLLTLHTVAHFIFSITQWYIIMPFVWMEILSLRRDKPVGQDHSLTN